MITELKGYAKATRATLSKVTALIVALAILCAGTAFAASPTAYNVDIYDGTEVTRVSTIKTDAEAIVKQAGISFGVHDALNLDRFVVGADSIVTVYRAADIGFVSLDGTVDEMIFAGTVGQLLEHLGVVLGDEILVNMPLDTVLADGMTVALQNAYHITVTADGETQNLNIGEGTVADALAKANVALDENDEVNPGSDTALCDALDITVYRVEYVERTEVETVSYAKKTVNSSSMYQGSSKVTQKGSNGSKSVVYQDKIVDGVYAQSSVVSETVLTQAVDQITTVGTKQRVLSVSALKNGGTPISELTPPSSLNIENGAPTQYKDVVQGKAAAYTASSGAKTASGRTVKPGYVAVNPNQFPYGTELWIVATDGTVYGYAIAADTGGFVNKGKFTVDLFMNTNSECKQWGSRDVLIYVL